MLGDGSTSGISSLPIEVLLPDHVSVTAIRVGNSTACGLTDHGAIYGWGRGEFGQLGDGNSDESEPFGSAVFNLKTGTDSAQT